MLSTVLLFRVLLAMVLLSSPYQSPSYGTYMPSLISNTLDTPLINCLTTSPLEMPSWTLQRSPVTYNMLASPTILLSMMCSLLYLDGDPCSVDWLCVPSHRISMDTPFTAEIQPPSTLMPPKPPWTQLIMSIARCHQYEYSNYELKINDIMKIEKKLKLRSLIQLLNTLMTKILQIEFIKVKIFENE
jgi:hypothetical protein